MKTLLKALCFSIALASPAWAVNPDNCQKGTGAALCDLATGTTIGGMTLLVGTGIYGDGSDGALTADGSTTLACFGAPSGNVYTQGRDCYLTNLTVNSGVTINTAGFRILGTGTLTNSGTIRNNGGAGPNDSTTGGTAASAGTYLGSTAGGAGATAGSGLAGTAGANLSNCIGAAGGASGTGAGGSAAGGTCTAPANTLGGFRQLSTAASGLSPTGTALNPGTGGGGGAGGAVTTTCVGPGAGAGGGIVGIIFKTITNNASSFIQANGGAGGSSTTGTGNCGGAGGGGGGTVFLVYNSLTNNGTIQAAGGAFGTGRGTGTNGSAGSAGNVIQMQ